MTLSFNSNQHPSAGYCYRHPKRRAIREIQGISLCSECVTEFANTKKRNVRKAVATRRRNAARRSQTGIVAEYESWETAFQQELAKKQNLGVAQVLQRENVQPHMPELFGRLFQYCHPADAPRHRIAEFRSALLKGTKDLSHSAELLRGLRPFDDLFPFLHSYVLDQLVLKPEIASKAGEWISAELRPMWNSPRHRLEPERLDDEAHDMTSFAMALKFLNKSLMKQGDGLAAPILIYIERYLRVLLDTTNSSSLLAKMLNSGFAVSGSAFRMKPSLLQKRLRDYRNQHPVTLHQLHLRVRLMIEGPQVLEEPGVRVYTLDSESVMLPNGKCSFLPRIALLPPLVRRTRL
jgi:hypothetical protein